MKKLLVRLLLVLGLVVPGAIAVGVSSAGATYGSYTCGYTPPAPNAVETCSAWVVSANGQANGWSYKVDATHHYGWWGSNFDPGTWHVIVYLYNNGNLWGQMMNLDVGDWALPHLFNGVGGSINSRIFLYNAGLGTGAPVYRTCQTTGVTSETWLEDTAGYDNYASGSFWPWGTDIEWGGNCQHGSGSHGNWVMSKSTPQPQNYAGNNWDAAAIQLN